MIYGEWVIHRTILPLLVSLPYLLVEYLVVKKLDGEPGAFASVARVKRIKWILRIAYLMLLSVIYLVWQRLSGE